MNHELFGGIEAGGTKFVCAVGHGDGKVIAKEELGTTSPDETLGRVINFFRGFPGLKAVGLGCFGPVEINPRSQKFGFIGNTPKKGWSNVDIKSRLEIALATPVRINTDVNCAALGEYYYGAAQGRQNFLYLTVGTGIGGAAMVDGHLLHGRMHPEMGHIRLPHDRQIDDFEGVCPFHGDCFEGLASGEAMLARVGRKAEKVIDPFRWDLEAAYLASGLTSLTSVLSPELVILGGGLMQHGGLMEEVAERVRRLMNGYLAVPTIVSSTEENAVLGAILLAAQARKP